MLWPWVVSFLAVGVLWAKNPYYIAVCGLSRSAEELDLALEMTDGVLVKKCGDKKLDAQIRLTESQIEATGALGLILTRKRSEGVVGRDQARQFVMALLKRLQIKPEKPKPKVEVQKVEEAKKTHRLEFRRLL